jgi:hypothetical protein
MRRCGQKHSVGGNIEDGPAIRSDPRHAGHHELIVVDFALPEKAFFGAAEEDGSVLPMHQISVEVEDLRALSVENEIFGVSQEELSAGKVV